MVPTNSSVQRAQDAVDASLARFESALSHLADRVEQTRLRVESIGETARRSKDELTHLKDRAKTAIEPLAPMLQQGKNISTRAISTVRENPRPYLWAFVGLVGAFLAYKSYQKNKWI
jgi:hypothetical protein